MRFLPLAFTLLLLAAQPLQAQEKRPTLLEHAHAHNDYQHARPLLDALEAGFRSVEADIHLVDGRLLVAHARRETRPEATLEKLYLDPLREIARRNGGSIPPGGPPLLLLIDLKGGKGTLYPRLRTALEQYRDLLTTWTDGRMTTGAVTVILTGSRPATEVFLREPSHLAALDGRLSDLATTVPSDLVPLVSEDWSSQFKWRGKGPMPEEERSRLRALVQRVHAQGRKLRFWGTPDDPGFWKELRSAGVDLIGADDLQLLRTSTLEGRIP